ncbi:bromodomain and PHD finger-containing protein 3-like isoform X1 [Sinocyclocheilus grahami]|uniref:bromodomain and PHD finger-containing protein 3-like isoform X1 n=1 Tax=Sinocyclocheilus grahami TaxID=75366 RepID=UPI0007ACAB35|nr:PREDICTED: bromodomain and PHD finger-containing protein 3-like isoform X1 [Sinocyclocheilus grahami]
MTGILFRFERSIKELNFSTTRDTLTYAQAQKMVETELEGRLHRINICEQLSVVTEDEMLAQDLTECNSNKENSEQRQGNKQPASKSKRKDGKHTAKKKSSSQYGLQNQVAHIQTPLPKPTFCKVDTFMASEAPPLPVGYYRYMEKSGEELDNEAEYDMDEEDMAWLEMVNQKRVSDGHASVPPDTFELLIDRLERESILESRSQTLSQSTIDEDAYCCICLDDECLNSNVILFCDICNLAVHQECYGVPYIPEGQWLCRRCLQSPSRPVDCVLCPNQGGAFKQTSDGSWAHVICAIWIPEVCFANTVFLEPVEGVKNIPPARWKLTCYLCKQKGRGASIQCHKANCYRAFHVTCAQRAGLYMKIDPVRETGAIGTTFTVKKTAYCENHLPPGTGTEGDEDNGLVGGRGNRGQRSYTLGPPLQQNQNGRKKGSAAQQKKTQRNSAGASRKTGVPLLLVPQIPSFRLNKICTGVSVDRKNQFMQRLHNYWLLKRHSRNGVPLIRRLHSHLQAQKSEQREPDAKLQAVREELKYWQKLRQDLEKARLLIELIRKRERLKREQMKLQQATLEMQLTPSLVFLRSTLEQLQEKDTDHIFTTPVNLKEVPDYLEFVSEPMDFSTMRDKLEAHKYSSVADLESDFNLMISNCLRYNSNDTVFHKAAMQLREVGRAILRHAQLQALSIGLDPITGMHLPEKPSTHNATVSWWDEVDLLLDPENRVHMSPEDQLKTLLDKLDLMSSMRTSGGRTKRMRLLRREINSLRHKISHQDRKSRLLNRKIKEEKSKEEKSDEMDYITSNTAEDPKKSTLKKVQEPTCPASSPLPGDAPPNPPMFCLEAGRTTTAQSNKTGSRKQRAKGKERGLKENHDQTLEEDKNFHTKEQDPSTQEDAVIRVSSTETPSDSPKMGVGRRTSILFKKAKNGTRLAKDKPVLLQNGVSKAENVASSEQTTPAKLLSASPAPKSPSPSPHQLRSRGLSTCSDSEGEKAHSPPEENGFTNGLKRHSGNSSDSESCTPTFPAHSSSPLKRSRGKPALSKVPVGEENGVSNANKETSQNDEMEPLTLVWAKCHGYPSYPAMIVNPNMPREGILHNGIPIPVPPKDVLDLGKRRKEETEEKLFLVLFFDTKRTWQWLPLDKLHHMGIDDTVDRLRLMEGKKPNVRKSVHMAYDRAMTHLSHVKENSTFNPSNFI